jgi:hypothetical protein
MQWKALALALLADGAAAQSMIRFGCSQLVIDRIDPLVNPGLTPSPHLHQIVGGNSFNASMDPASHDLVKDSTCTTCTYSEDFSNYWTAVMFFRARNGTFKRVPQYSNVGLRGVGGITVYYIPPYDGKTTVTAFKPGFRMLVGEAGLRNNKAMQRQLCHRCLGVGGDGGAPCTGKDTQSLPKAPCPNGMRVTVTFPTCWDGKNTDSPDHKSHIAYPSRGTFESTGTCPDTHPVRLPQIMYEVMWDVSVSWALERNCGRVTDKCLRRPVPSTTRRSGPKMALSPSSGALATRTASPTTATTSSDGREIRCSAP